MCSLRRRTTAGSPPARDSEYSISVTTVHLAPAVALDSRFRRLEHSDPSVPTETRLIPGTRFVLYWKHTTTRTSRTHACPAARAHHVLMVAGAA